MTASSVPTRANQRLRKEPLELARLPETTNQIWREPRNLRSPPSRRGELQRRFPANLGPLASAALTLPLLDGGRRKSGVEHAHAVLEERTANYRQQVLLAFQEVEDRLSDLRILDVRTQTEADAVRACQRAEVLSKKQYSEGAVTYLDVLDAERTLLPLQQQANKLTDIRAVSTVNLVRALGGGWGDLPSGVAFAERKHRSDR